MKISGQSPEHLVTALFEESTLQDVFSPASFHGRLYAFPCVPSWPWELYVLARSKARADAVDTTAPRAHASKEVKPGATGLTNLGNTCYMSSAIQCLSATEPLSSYFLKGCHLGEINLTNPIGTKGALARQYGRLLRQLWARKVSIAPVKVSHSPRV